MVSVIILNYRGEKFVEKCLKSVLSTDYANFEVLFVDNASNDGSVRLVNDLFGDDPRLKIIVNPKNVGFALGNNVGATYAKGKYLVFLNNDTEVDKSWLKELVKAIDSDPKVAIVGCKIITSFKGEAEALLVDQFGHSYPAKFPNSVKEVFAVEGAAFLIRRDVWEELGGFDSRYFALCEDIDLCWRAHLLGYRILVAPSSIVYHVGSSTISKSRLVKRRYLDFRNGLRTLIKNYSLKTLFRLLPIYFLIELTESAFVTLKLKDANVILAYSKAILWNLINLKNAMALRLEIQSSRTISDKAIIGKMMKGSAKLSFFLKYPIKLG
jgi:hypothetical protein